MALALHYQRMVSAKRLSPHDERAVAVRAGVDPRTVRAYLAGRDVRSTVASRIADALREHRNAYPGEVRDQ